MMQNRGVSREPADGQGGTKALSAATAAMLHESTYHGERDDNGGCRVWIERKRGHAVERTDLPLHLEVREHSPTGFAWGYGGSGPAQLALALLIDALGDREMAERHYQEFKRAHVAGWRDRWSITAEEIRFFVLSRVTRDEPPAKALFHPGQILSTPGVLDRVPQGDLLHALTRHLTGDWGDLDEHDWHANEAALKDGSRLLSAYVTSNGVRFWIITESDRSATTSLLPEEY